LQEQVLNQVEPGIDKTDSADEPQVGQT